MENYFRTRIIFLDFEVFEYLGNSRKPKNGPRPSSSFFKLLYLLPSYKTILVW